MVARRPSSQSHLRCSLPYSSGHRKSPVIPKPIDPSIPVSDSEPQSPTRNAMGFVRKSGLNGRKHRHHPQTHESHHFLHFYARRGKLHTTDPPTRLFLPFSQMSEKQISSTPSKPSQRTPRKPATRMPTALPSDRNRDRKIPRCGTSLIRNPRARAGRPIF